MRKLTVILMSLSVLLLGGLTVGAKTTKKSSAKSISHKVKKHHSSSNASVGTDLSIFNLQGNVKSVKYDAKDDYCWPSPFIFNGMILFSETGECTNLDELFQNTMLGVGQVSVKRNKRGEVTSIYCEDSNVSDCLAMSFKWKDGKLIRTKDSNCRKHEESRFNFKYNGSRISQLDGKGAVYGFKTSTYTSVFKFADFKEDSNGNWIECTITATHRLKEDNVDQTPTTDTYRIKRTIEYYP